MYDVQWDSEGFGEALNRMRALPIAFRGKAGRSALGAAARVVVTAARENAQRLDNTATSRAIYKNIVARNSPKYHKQTGDLMFRIGVLGGSRNYEAYGEFKTGKSATGNPGGDTFYWRFIEFGTERAAARPFMRPALEKNTGEATDAFLKGINKYIDRLLKQGKI